MTSLSKDANLPNQYIDLNKKENKLTDCRDVLAIILGLQSLIKETWPYTFESAASSSTSAKELFESRAITLQQEWMLKFHNFQEQDKQGRTVSDIMYVLLCHIRFAVRSSDEGLPSLATLESRSQYHRNNIMDVLGEVRALACQHTPESSTYWPDSDYISTLSIRIAALIVLCIPSNDASNLKDVVASETTTQRLEALRMKRPESDVEKRKREQEEEEEKKLTGDAARLAKDKRQQYEEMAKSPIALGRLFRMDAESVCDYFLSQCSTIMAKIELDTYVSNMLADKTIPLDKQTSTSGTVSGFGYRNEAYTRHTKALTETLSTMAVYTSQSDTFRKGFSSLVYETMLPLGSRMEQFRSHSSMYRRVEASVLFQDELGLGNQTYMHWLVTSHKPHEIISKHQHSHPLYPHACLSLMVYLLFQKHRVHFYDHYFINSTQLYSRFETHLMNSRVNHRERRPVIVSLKRRWWVHHRGQLIETHGLFDALVMWCVLLRRDFNCVTEYADDLKPLIDQFLDGIASTKGNKSKRRE